MCSSTLIEDRLKFFCEIAEEGWDESPPGTLLGLNAINFNRVEYVRTQLKLRGVTNVENELKPLKGLDILDVGCGAGMASESFALLGGQVTGIDPSEELVKMAVKHAAQSPTSTVRNIKYVNCTLEDYVKAKKEQNIFDVVIVFFVLEHMKNSQEFLQRCLQILKPNGSLFLLNANRTIHCWLMVKWNQHVTRILHKKMPTNWEQLKSTDEIIQYLCEGNKCQLKDRRGFTLTFDGKGFKWISSTDFINITHFIKTKGESNVYQK